MTIIDETFKCAVEQCFSKAFHEIYCKTHTKRYHVNGSPTPIKICFGCRREFQWVANAFRTMPYCDECLPFVKEHWGLMPNNSGMVTAHGITPVEYLKMLMAQEFRCAISACRALEKKPQRLCIDHDHKCCPGRFGCQKCVRGLVCKRCNTIIGVIEGKITYYQSNRNRISNKEIERRIEKCLDPCQHQMVIIHW